MNKPTNAATVWSAVQTLIDELDCGDRCVEYTVDGSVRDFDWVNAWLEQKATIRYFVDPNFGGVVRVDFTST